MSEADVGTSQETQTSPMGDEGDVAHGACCRDPAWLGGTLRAFCGYEGDQVMLTAESFCTMCAEEILRLRPGWMSEPADTCPVDGQPCPDDLALLDMVARRVLPP